MHIKSFRHQTKQSSTSNFAAGFQYQTLDLEISDSEFDGLGPLMDVSPFLGAMCLVNNTIPKPMILKLGLDLVKPG